MSSPSAKRFTSLVARAVGERPVNQVAKEWGIPQKTLESWVKAAKSPGEGRPDPRISSVDKVAKKLGKFEGWQILTPGFDPAHPPVLAGESIMAAATDDERDLLAYYRSLGPEGKQALLSVRINEGASPKERSKRLGGSAA